MTLSLGSCADGNAFAQTPGTKMRQPRSSCWHGFRPCSSWGGWVWVGGPRPCRTRHLTLPPPRRSGWALGRSSLRLGDWWWRGAYGAGSPGLGGERCPALPPPHPPQPWGKKTTKKKHYLVYLTNLSRNTETIWKSRSAKHYNLFFFFFTLRAWLVNEVTENILGIKIK